MTQTPKNFLQAIWTHGDVHEIRIPGFKEGNYEKTMSGYFDSPEAADQAIKDFDGKGLIYVTINPVNPALMARSANHITRQKSATADKEIVEIRFFPLDIDAKRPAGISATAEELRHAMDLTLAVRDYIYKTVGTLPYIEGMSGNGYYLMYNITPQTADVSTKIKEITALLKKKFDNEHADIDEKVFNPSRILKVLGTMAVKGENTKSRPHRRSKIEILREKDETTTLSNEKMDRLLATLELEFPTPIKAEKVKVSAISNRGTFVVPDLSKFNLTEWIQLEYPGTDFKGQTEHLDCPFYAHSSGRSGGIKPRMGGGEVFVCGGDPACPARQNPVDVIRLLNLTRGLNFKEACHILDVPLPEPEYHGGNGNGNGKYQKGKYLPEDDVILPLPPPPADQNKNEFPLDILPFTWQAYIDQVSKCIGVPPDFISMALYLTAASVTGNSCVIEIRKGWQEQPSMFWSAVYDISGGKSPSLNKAIRLVAKIEDSLRLLNEEKLKQFKEAEIRYEVAISDWKKKKIGSIPEKPEPPMRERLFTSDATVEAIARILAENPHGILLFRDELTAWINAMNQYKGGRGSDRQFFLSVWSGSPGPVDRVKSPPLWIPKPFLTIMGGMPPEELQSLHSSAAHDGLLERILFSWPTYQKRRWTKATIDPEVEEQILEEMWRMYNSKQAVQATASTRVFQMTTEAQDLFGVWFDKIQEEIEHPDTIPALKGFYGKLISYCARFALMQAVIWHRCETDVVGIQEVKEAIALAEYFKQGYIKIFGQIQQTDEDKTVIAIIKWAREKGLKEIKPLDLYRYTVAGTTNARTAKKNIELLVSAGFALWVNREKYIVKLAE